MNDAVNHAMNHAISKNTAEKWLDTWLKIGRENYWITECNDPVFDRDSFYIAGSLGELIGLISVGNWSAGTAVAYMDLCLINQVNGGDEWLVIRQDRAFESFTCGRIASSGRRVDGKTQEWDRPDQLYDLLTAYLRLPDEEIGRWVTDAEKAAATGSWRESVADQLRPVQIAFWSCGGHFGYQVVKMINNPTGALLFDEWYSKVDWESLPATVRGYCMAPAGLDAVVPVKVADFRYPALADFKLHGLDCGDRFIMPIVWDKRYPLNWDQLRPAGAKVQQ